MDSSDARNMIGVLAKLMDEQSEHTDVQSCVLEQYNALRQEINIGLVSAVEKVSYQKKYAVIDDANALADAIGLYLNYPELIDKYVIGFYSPNGVLSKSICSRYLGSADSESSFLKRFEGRFTGLSDTIPTILTNGKDGGEIRALNLADKIVPLSPEDYSSLERKKSERVDLAGILSTYHLSSPAVPQNQAVVVIPKGVDRQQDIKTLFFMLDTLVILDTALDAPAMELIRGGNIKQLVVRGNCDGAKKAKLDALAAETSIEVTYLHELTEVFDALRAPERNIVTNNFCNKTYMESCLCGVLWHFAEQKMVLSGQVAQINQDLLSEDAEISKPTKALQQRVGDQIRALDLCADVYDASMQNILKRIEELERLCGSKPSEVINLHIGMRERTLELLAAEGMFFQYYKRPNSNDHIRSLEMQCIQAGGNAAVARVLVNSYYSRGQSAADLAEFARYPTKSSLLKKKKLVMYQQLKLSLYDCANLIRGLDLPLSPMEYRLLGEAQFRQGQTEAGKESLKMALLGGDLEAGDYLLDNVQYVDIAFLADNGVAKAAYQYGKMIYEKQYCQTSQAKQLNEAMKYLHIAACREHSQSLELLGDIWFTRALSEGKSMRNASLGKALQYYNASKKKKKPKKTTLERMGLIYCERGDYKSAKDCLEKAETPQAFFLLGKMYENGQGMASNENKALEYYEKAVNAGHAQAQVEYSRLSTILEAKKAKETINAQTSYSSSSYYSGYYSSGW